jgi:hypothetical protein
LGLYYKGKRMAMEHVDTTARAGVTAHLAIWAGLLGLILAAIFVFAGRGAPFERFLSITLNAAQPGGLQVFYDLGTGFSEADSAHVTFAAGLNNLSIPLPDAGLRVLRLDPDPAVAPVTVELQNIAIQTPRKAQSLELPLPGVSPLNEIASIDHTPSGVTVRTVSGAKDPQLLLAVRDDWRPPGWAGYASRISREFLLLALGAWVVIRLARSKMGLPVPALLLGGWLLVAAMALTSTTGRSVHPDEHDHVAVARYYLSHWMPPAVDSPEIVDSYSVWGATYHSELDVVYLIAAKATQFWPGFGLDETTALRLFNVLLLGILLGVAWVRRNVWDGIAVLLLTPQIWYVFSYFNADAFPLFLSLLVAMLFAAPDSPVSRFVDGERASRLALCLFVLGLGLLLISKRNYPPVVFVVGLSLAVRHLGLDLRGILLGAAGATLLLLKLVAGEQLVNIFPGAASWLAPTGLILLALFAVRTLLPVFRQSLLRPRLYRLGLLAALALIVALPRVVADVAVNGGPAQKAERMSIAAEHYAGPLFKPSVVATNLSASYPGIHLAAKGVTFSQVMGQPYEWATISWRSMLGVYGYMSIFAPPVLYWLLSAGMIVLCLGLVWWALTHMEGRLGLAVAGAGIVLVVLSSVVHSWVNVFQPQGRYLLPGLAIIAIYLLSQPGLLRTRWVAFGVALCFVGSVLSFASVALPALAGR